MFECVVGLFIMLLLEYVILNFVNFLKECWFCYSCCWLVSRRVLSIVLLLCVSVWCGCNCCYLEFCVCQLILES